MRKFYWSILLVGITFYSAKGEADTETSWYEGAVVYQDQSVETGLIRVMPFYDLILLKNDQGLRVLPAHKISKLNYYDHQANINRRFQTIEVNKGARTQTRLYEIVVSGVISVVRHARYKISDGVEVPENYTYFVQQQQELFPLESFGHKVLPTLQIESELERFMKQEHYNPNIPAHVILIIQYGNKLYRELSQPS